MGSRASPRQTLFRFASPPLAISRFSLAPPPRRAALHVAPRDTQEEIEWWKTRIRRETRRSSMSDHNPISRPPEVTPVVVLQRGPRRLEAIDLLDGISHLMDRAFEVPGSNVRFGLNSLLLLLPGLGDLIAGGIS